MPDIQELSDGDMSVVERMKGLPDSVLFGDGVEEDTKAGQGRGDDPEAPDEIRDGPEAADDADDGQAENEQEAAAQAPEDQEFEIPDPDGGEPRKVTLSELLDAEREYTAFKEERASILSRVQHEATQEAQGMVQQTREAMTNISHHLRAVLQHIQPPQPPPLDMLQPQSQRYDPDGYHLARAQFEAAMERYNFIGQAAKDIATRQAGLDAARDEREFKALTPHWPEFTDPVKGQAVQTEFMAAMNKHYGYSPEELDRSLTDHRNALVARDALKWREHAAKQATAKTTLKEKVVAKAPAKTGATQAASRTLTTDQSSYMNARKALKANGKDMQAAARGFMRFL